MNRYESGSVVEVKGQFVDKAGAPADPDPGTTVLKYRKDVGSTVSTAPTKLATGTYVFDLDTTGWSGPGDQVWTYQYSGTGNVQAIGSKVFGVYPPAL